MSLEELIAELRALTPEELERVREVLGGTLGDADAAARYERGLAAWESVLAGFGTAGGHNLSDTIDDAVYGAER